MDQGLSTRAGKVVGTYSDGKEEKVGQSNEVKRCAVVKKLTVSLSGCLLSAFNMPGNVQGTLHKGWGRSC